MRHQRDSLSDKSDVPRNGINDLFWERTAHTVNDCKQKVNDENS